MEHGDSLLFDQPNRFARPEILFENDCRADGQCADDHAKSEDGEQRKRDQDASAPD